ncbi:MAG: GNAT family N-acetyltransferase [Fimbriimonas sp.]|nr:GNAT family N-acetyltransferase [Fimbriimonas sp.]
MVPADVLAAVALQKLAFPPPFSEDLHWDHEHLLSHIETFSDGQFVACDGDRIVGSCSNAILSEESWLAHGSWADTVGGPFIRRHCFEGTTLYGLDITVHPEFRRQGIGRAFYGTRFDLVRDKGLDRYGTGCRLPDYRWTCETQGSLSLEEYARRVVEGQVQDRTLSPLLRYGLCFLGIVEDYMQDEESGHAAALLEWLP